MEGVHRAEDDDGDGDGDGDGEGRDVPNAECGKTRDNSNNFED